MASPAPLHKVLKPLEAFGLISCYFEIKKFQRGIKVTVHTLVYKDGKHPGHENEAKYPRLLRNWIKEGSFGYATGFTVVADWVPGETKTHGQGEYQYQTVIPDRIEMTVKRDELPPKQKCQLTKAGKVRKLNLRPFK